MTIRCADPLHVERSHLDGWATTLGAGDDPGGHYCAACASVLPRPDTSAKYNADLAILGLQYASDGATRIYRFDHGVHKLDAPLDVPSGVIVDGGGVAVLRAGFSGGVDDPSHAVVRCRGSAGVVATTLAVDAKRGATSIVVSSATGIQAGAHLLLERPITPSQGVEMVRVGAAYAGGTTIPLDWPLDEAWSATDNVTDVVPFRDGGVRGIRVEGAAVGVLVQSAVRAIVENVTARDMTRTAVEVRGGSQGVTVRDTHGAGRLNGLVHVYASRSCRVLDTTTGVGERAHPSGYARSALICANNAKLCVVDGADVRYMSAGLWVARKVDQCRFSNLSFSHLDGTRALADGQITGERAPAGFGVAVELSSFAPDGFIGPKQSLFENITATDLDFSNPSLADASAMLFHDMVDCHVDNMAVIGLTDASKQPRGIRIHDNQGTNRYKGMTLRGCQPAIWISQSPTEAQLHNVIIDGSRGSGASAAITFDCSHGVDHRIEIHNLRTTNTAGYVFSDPVGELEIFQWDDDGTKYDRVRLAYNRTGTAMNSGDEVEMFTESGELRVQPSLVPNAVVAKGSGFNVTGKNAVLIAVSPTTPWSGL